MKTTSKVTTTPAASTKATDKAKATVAVKVSAGIAALIAPLATSEAAVSKAIDARERQIVIFGDKLEKDPMAKAGRVAVREALAPLFIAAYAKQGKDKLYAGQQLARVLLLAFGPASDKVTQSQRVKLKANKERAIREGQKTEVILGMTGGSLTYTRDGKIAKVAKGGSGGSNRKTPLETFNATVESAVTLANTGKVPPLAMINALLDALKACEAISEDEADDISAAAKKTL